MLELRIDLRSALNVAECLKAAIDQLPFAMSRAMNDAAFETRKYLVEQTWPSHVTQRNPHFPSAVLHVDRATKANLEVSINEDRISTAPLKPHAEGGTKHAQKKELTIPMPWYRADKMTQRGLRKDARARAIIDRTPKRALRVTKRGIFVGEGGKLRLVFALKQSVPIPKDVPFYEDFIRIMSDELNKQLPVRLEEAMATRKPNK